MLVAQSHITKHTRIPRLLRKGREGRGQHASCRPPLSGHASLQPEFRIELEVKHDTGRRPKVILRKLVVLELEEVGSREFQLERPESEVACEVVVGQTAKRLRQSPSVYCWCQTSPRLRALPNRTWAKGVVVPWKERNEGQKGRWTAYSVG